MSLSSTAYNYGKKEFFLAGIDYDTDTVNVALLTTGYTPDIDADQYWTDVSASEVVGAGYTASGAAIANISATMDATNDLAYIDGDDSEWTSATLADLRYAVLWKATTDPATSPLIGYVNFGADKTLTDGTFTITWATAGIMKIT